VTSLPRSESVRQLVCMEVAYELTSKDLYAFQWRAVFATSRGRRARRGAYVLWLLTVLIFSALPAIGSDGFVISRLNFTFLGVALPTVFLFQWCLDRLLVRRAIRQLLKDEKPGKGQLGMHRMVLSDDGLVESTAVGESRIVWAGVDRVEQNPDYIFIYTSPVAAHVIPKRAFKDAEEADAFRQFCLTHRAAVS
jgi:YcxB-like protein